MIERKMTEKEIETLIVNFGTINKLASICDLMNSIRRKINAKPLVFIKEANDLVQCLHDVVFRIAEQWLKNTDSQDDNGQEE